MIQSINFFSKSLILVLNKPFFLTSNQAIQLIKKFSSCDKIGHAGTLDQAASGVLIVCTNCKTKSLSLFVEQHKRYIVFCIVGIESDTLDIFGKIKYFNSYSFKIKKNIIKFFLSSIKMTNVQTPPIYSSIKHNGYSLYKYSRLDIDVKIKLHSVIIYKIFLIKLVRNVLIIDIECSKGTYVREVVNNLSFKVNLPMIVYRIVRLKFSNYSILESVNFF